ncbi:MAG TPA: HoxN/HupN/NixA family nickel/cobalt transporter [Candidatus Dormibacteraeota bacterium]|jgi:high-affinity nickel-transport protein|nr:HoxN/HupN/NixA family nickel/cobalt transporter [Candidatus Dormibacteraeota bacterium]
MAAAGARLGAVRRVLTPAEWRRAAGLAAAVIALHVIGWGTLILFVAPRYPNALGLGVGVLAYTFGLRHAFDADHISAIDNTTRKFMADGKRPLGVGFFFSLGHSTVVLGLAVALSFVAKSIVGQVSSSGSALHSVGGLIGTAVSSGFLFLIGALNLVILLGILRVFREMRRGRYDDAELERQLNSRGLMNRFFGPLSRAIKSSWQMYPLGFLFGLGFDTASEIALLALAAGAASTGLPFYAVLCLPVIFAAGMSLLDTLDGAFMSFAYGWAFAKPLRKVYYNITVTGLSVAVALIVGTVEVLSILADRLDLHGGFWGFVASFDLNRIGFLIVGLFVVTWIGAIAVWKFARIEDRWALRGAGGAPIPPLVSSGEVRDSTPR